MRSIYCAMILALLTLCHTGCASLINRGGCGNGCGPIKSRMGGLLGRLRGECSSCQVGARGLARGIPSVGCRSCGATDGCQCRGNQAPYTPEFSGPHGPMTPTYGYPYYTTRAPRDFFMNNPPSIGP